MKRLPFLLVLLLAFACKPDPYLTLSVKELQAPAEGGPLSFSISTREDWTLLCDGEWCTAAPLSGSGSADVSLACQPNTTYGLRSCLVRVRAGELQASVVVTQVQNDAVLVSPAAFDLDGRLHIIQVEVGANVAYEVEIDPACRDWIQPEESSRSLSYRQPRFVVSACAPEAEPREGSIRFRQKDGGASSVVTVRQAPRSAVLADSLVYHVPAEGGLLEIDLQSNISYTATVQYSAQGWLSIQEEAGTRVLTPSVCRVQVGAHSGRTLREGTVTFAPADASVKADPCVVTVSQFPPKSLLLVEHAAAAMPVPRFDGDTFTCLIDWGDGVVDTWKEGLVHSFAPGATYVTRIEADGNFNSIEIPSLEGILHLDLCKF